ncbi:MAG: lipocalin-like domain-containing protein [Bryobacteraceae bacterium]|nr:lipocalin-like domain-containing protein [Bryobacteraceae bacterium]
MTRRQLFATAPLVWRKALPGYRYEFPRDHFAHPEFQTEWWYYTGNVASPDGRPFGFELTFFRQGADRTEAQSIWHAPDIYLAHLALSDIRGKRFHHRERLNRPGPGIAGASFDERRIWNGNWQVRWDGETQRLAAVADDFSIRLDLTSKKPPVIHGRDGVSQKSPGEGRASHYVSLTRLLASGEISIAGERFPVSGTSWMDHEFFSNQLSSEHTGWDWFSIQLDNGADLMLYRLRKKDGSVEPLSHGTFVDPQGRARELRLAEFTLTPTGRTHGRYPISWRIAVPSLGVDLQVETPLADQELKSRNPATPSYWEGAMRFTGKPSNGVGYLEMTGYDGAVSF